MVFSNIFKLFKVVTLVIIIAALNSCNSTNGVFQKRKYTKGHHISLKKKVADNKNIIAPINDELMQKDTPETEVKQDNRSYANSSTPDTLEKEKSRPDAFKLDIGRYNHLKPIKTLTRTNSILAKITPYIQDKDIGKKIIKAIETKNLTSLDTKWKKDQILMISLFLLSLFLLGQGINLIWAARAQWPLIIGGIILGIVSLLLAIKIKRKIEGKTKKKTHSSTPKNTLGDTLIIFGIILFGVSGIYMLFSIWILIIGIILTLFSILLGVLLYTRRKNLKNPKNLSTKNRRDRSSFIIILTKIILSLIGLFILGYSLAVLVSFPYYWLESIGGIILGIFLIILAIKIKTKKKPNSEPSKYSIIAKVLFLIGALFLLGLGFLGLALAIEELAAGWVIMLIGFGLATPFIIQLWK